MNTGLYSRVEWTLASRQTAVLALFIVGVSVFVMLPIGTLGKDLAPASAFLGMPLAALGFGLIIPRGKWLVSVGGGILGGVFCSLLAVALAKWIADQDIAPKLLGAALATAIAFARMFLWSFFPPKQV